MEKMNSTRNSEDKNMKDKGELFDFFLISGVQPVRVASTLKAQGWDQKDIDIFIEQLEVSRKKVSKMIKKFVEKIETKYGHLDIPDLVKKGMKHASKLGFSNAEKEALKNYILNKNTDVQYTPFQELGYSEMSKFLGFSEYTGQALAVTAVDQPALQEIARLYETSKLIHSGIRHNLVSYTSCDPNALLSTYDKEKHNLSLFIHPLIVALFLVRIKAIEKRMLYSNIGRLVVQRSQMYFQKIDDKKINAKYLNWNLSMNDLIPGELEADLEFMWDIAKDPNSLDHFNDETPMANLLKRFSVQIELWKNVLALRQGKFYSNTTDYNDGNGIMGLHKVLSSYAWTYFDSPDMYHINDEGNLLRKLLAVFSFRPTLIQLSSFGQKGLMGYSNLPAISKATFINSPICNIRLPTTLLGTAAVNGPAISLSSALSKSEWYIENKMVVPKNTSIIYSRSVIFFYINRRYQSPLANIDMGFRYLSVPGTISGLTTINTAEVNVLPDIVVGNDKFDLTSVVVLNPLLEDQLATGCSAMVVYSGAAMGNPDRYYYYNPLDAGIMYANSAGKYVRNDPITRLKPNSMNGDDSPGFYNMARNYGTILVYVNPLEN